MEDKASELIDSLRAGKKVYDSFSLSFRQNYLIFNKPIEEWEHDFKLIIPEDLDPTRCKLLAAKLMDLHQEASFYKASARASLQALKKGSDTEYRTRMTQLVNEYEAKGAKLPAAATLAALAKTHVDDVDAAIMAATIALDFWEDLISHLAFSRKIIENMIMHYGIEAKINKGNL